MRSLVVIVSLVALSWSSLGCSAPTGPVSGTGTGSGSGSGLPRPYSACGAIFESGPLPAEYDNIRLGLHGTSTTRPGGTHTLDQIYVATSPLKNDELYAFGAARVSRLFISSYDGGTSWNALEEIDYERVTGREYSYPKVQCRRVSRSATEIQLFETPASTDPAIIVTVGE